MFNLYQSNRLEVLSEVCAAVLAQPVGRPLDPDVVLVQSQGIQRWLQFELAKSQGVAANLDVKLPGGFIWGLLKDLVSNIPKRSPFDTEVLSWRLLSVLPNVLDQSPDLKDAWVNASPRGRYNLAWRVADVFDQYLIYRPEWLSEWSAGRLVGVEETPKDELWQMALWRELTRAWGHADDMPYRANLLKQLQKAILTAPERKLPKRLSIFGISNLPAIHREILETLSTRIPVFLYLQNPCQEFWGDVRRQQSDSVLENPLLASWGSQGKSFIEAVTSGTANDFLEPEFRDYPADTLLGALQQDILERRQRDESSRLTMNADDHSLRIHVCHSAMREVEVLHDELRRRFEQDPTLEPHDVLVMTTDIAKFAPIVDAVFGAQEGVARIPYSIADRRTREETPILDTFKQLLAIGQTRFEQEIVLGLLEEPLLAAAFDLSVDDLPTIKRWLSELQLRWGLNKEDREREGLPASSFTWEAVLNRLFMGFVLPPYLATGFDARHMGVLPVDLVEGSKAITLSRLYRFVQALSGLSKNLNYSRTPKAWSEFLYEVIENFFHEEDGEQLQLLRDLAHELGEQAELSQMNDAVSASVLLTWYERTAQGIQSRRGFLQGAVTVCAMVPMRSLPFKFIAILGLDDGVFPRHQRPWGFDLMRLAPRAGDRSRREDDRYLFLETLLAAGETLHLSYVGRSQIDGTVRPPSAALAELIDVIDATAVSPTGGKPSEFIEHVHTLQPFSPVNFLNAPTSRYVSYSADAYAAAQALQIRLNENSQITTIPQFKLPQPLERVTELDITQLIRGMRNPARLLLKERFDIQSFWADEMLVGEEPIDLDFGAQRTLREGLFSGIPADAEYWSATGILPAGEWGRRLLEKEAHVVEQLKARLPEHITEFLPPVDVAIEMLDLTLMGRFNQLNHDQTQRYWVFRKISAGDRIELWLKHLLLCASGQFNTVRSELYPLEGRTVAFQHVDKLAAEDYLSEWVSAWRNALCEPLPFFPKVSFAFADNNEENRLPKAIEAWVGSDHATGDGANYAAKTIWGDFCPVHHPEFEKWAFKLIQPMLNHTVSAKAKEEA